MISGSVDNVISAAALPYLFGMRLLYPGFSKLVSSFNLKRPEVLEGGMQVSLGAGAPPWFFYWQRADFSRSAPLSGPSAPQHPQREPADLSGCGLDPARLLLRPVLAAKQQLMIPQGGFIC